MTPATRFLYESKQRPLNGLRGACLQGCKVDLVRAGVLPPCILRSAGRPPSEELDKLQSRQAHEGLFSDDIVERPQAYARLFRDLKIYDAHWKTFLSLTETSTDPADAKESPPLSRRELRRYLYPLVFNALGWPLDLLNENFLDLGLVPARIRTYAFLQNYWRSRYGRNLEFWNRDDKIAYNILFGEFNFAWLSVLDIFESPDLNPGYKVFKRIFPLRAEDLGKAIYTPNRKGPPASLEVDPLDAQQVPAGAIFVYRAGSAFTRGVAANGEVAWDHPQNSIASLWAIDGLPGHIESCGEVQWVKAPKSPAPLVPRRDFCSDGKTTRPATEWTGLNREIFAIYLPL